MGRKALLRELAALSHAGRCRRMVEVGRLSRTQARGSAEAAATLAVLGRGTGYERRMAMQAAWGTRDAGVAARSLADPSRLVRQAAVPLAAALCDGAALADALDRAAPARMHAFMAEVRQRRRGAALHTYIEKLAARADPGLGALLEFGSASFVADALPRMAGEAMLDWPGLARAHPDVVARYLTGVVAGTPELDARTASMARLSLPVLSGYAPDAAVELARALAEHVSPDSLPLDRLLTRRPDAVADLFLHTGAERPPGFGVVAHRLGTGRLLALLRRFGGLGGWAGPEGWLRRLRPEQRGAVYGAVGLGWRDSDGVVALPVLALLPQPARGDEARRHLALPALQTRPAARLPYTALLGWDEARAALALPLGDPDPELRAVAWRALTGCVRYNRNHLQDLLALVAQRRHEQDPVRGAFLGGLADLPPSAWQAGHLADLGAVLRHALDATDLSAATAGHIERLLLALVPWHPDWATGWVARVAQERGTLGASNLEHRLRDADVRRLAPALDPILRGWMKRDRQHAVFNLAQQLGRLALAWDSLAALVEAALDGTADHASTALWVLSRIRPDRVGAVVPTLLRRDPSWIVQPVAHAFLHRARQDLLTPFLGRRAYQGRFSTGRTYFVLPFESGFGRWTPEQQVAFVQALEGVLDDAGRDSPALISTVRQLAAQPDVPPGLLERIAALANPRVFERDAALRGLGRRDAGDGLAALMAALDDERGRVAIYALRRCLLDMPAADALAALRCAPMTRVTVAKEVVRLAGDLPGDAAHAWLHELDAQDLHRDVRVALLRAFWEHLERDATWPVLARAAAASDPAVAMGLTRLPADGLSVVAGQRFAGLLAVLMGHGTPTVRVAALVNCPGARLADRDEVLLSPMLAALESPLQDESAAAACAVFATYAGRRADRVGAAVTAVRGNRRTVREIAAQVQIWAWSSRQGEPAGRAVLDALSPDPRLAGVCAGLAVRMLPAGAVAGYFEGAKAGLHGDAVRAAAETLEVRWVRPAEDLAAIEAALAASSDERLRRLALSALRGQAAAGGGWTEARRQRLQAFRDDPAPLVAEAAEFTFPPD